MLRCSEGIADNRKWKEAFARPSGFSCNSPERPAPASPRLFLLSACLLDTLCLLKAAFFVRRFADERSGICFWFSWHLLPSQALARV